MDDSQVSSTYPIHQEQVDALLECIREVIHSAAWVETGIGLRLSIRLVKEDDGMYTAYMP